MRPNRKSYLSDVSDEEWSFCASYLTLMKEEAPQRDHPLREVFNALRWFVRAGCPWRMMPNDLPPWHVVYQQTRRWLVPRGLCCSDDCCVPATRRPLADVGLGLVVLPRDY